MKTRYSILSVALIALSLTSACTTTKTGQSVPNPAVLTMVAQEAASVGTTMWLANPSHAADRDKFVLARTSLKGLVAAGSGSAADLQAALAMLPISQLSGNNGAVLVSGAVVLIDAAGKQITSLGNGTVWNGYVLPVATGLIAGFDQALGP